MNWHGWAGRILNVNLTTGEIETEPLSKDFARKHIGGRGFGTRILYDEVGPEVDPMGPDNIIAIGSGPLSGTLSPGACRTDIIAKSPLTGIFGRTNLGGFFGSELKYAGYDLIVFRGHLAKPVYLLIKDDRVELKDAAHLWGKDTWETQRLIREELADSDIKTLKIGPAGENLCYSANVIGDIGRSASKCSIGAVWGSKNLKAVAVRGSRGVSVGKPKEMVGLAVELWERFKADPMYQTHVTYGRNAWVGNTAMRIKGVEMPNITAEALNEVYDKQVSCAGCALRCGHFYRIKSGEYQGMAGHGIEGNVQMWGVSHFQVDDGEFLCIVNAICDKLGMNVDIPAYSFAWAVMLFKEGIITKYDTDGLVFTPGNKETILKMIPKMLNKDGFGQILDAYPLRAAHILGRGSDIYAAHVKGLYAGGSGIMSTVKGTLAQAVATRGNDHLTGNPMIEAPNRQLEMTDEILMKLGQERYGDPMFFIDSPWNYQSKYALRVYEHEHIYTLRDLTGTCSSASHSPLYTEGIGLDDYARLLRIATGENFTIAETEKAAQRELLLERAYNAREGIRRIDDYPFGLRWQLEHGETHPKYGPPKLSLEDYDKLLDEYYRLRGCDPKTGIPTREKLTEVGLDDVAKNLAERGVITGKLTPSVAVK